MLLLWLYVSFSYGFMLSIVLNGGNFDLFDWILWAFSPLTILVFIYGVFKERML